MQISTHEIVVILPAINTTLDQEETILKYILRATNHFARETVEVVVGSIRSHYLAAAYTTATSAYDVILLYYHIVFCALSYFREQLLCGEKVFNIGRNHTSTCIFQESISTKQQHS